MSSYTRACPECGASYPTGAVRCENGHDIPQADEKPFKPRGEVAAGIELVSDWVITITVGLAVLLSFIWLYARYQMYVASQRLDYMEFAEVAQFFAVLSTAIPSLLAVAGIAFAIRLATRWFRDNVNP